MKKREIMLALKIDSETTYEIIRLRKSVGLDDIIFKITHPKNGSQEMKMKMHELEQMMRFFNILREMKKAL